MTMRSHFSRTSSPLWFLILTTTMTPAALAQDGGGKDVLAEDWAGVVDAYRLGQHAVFAMPDKLAAHNPRQGWKLGFDRRGFLVEPDTGGWSWGLQLVSYGFEENEHYVGEEACASSDGGRVAYQWDDAVEEWFVNDERGLEHGFTVRERPSECWSEDSGELTFRLRVRGNLVAKVNQDRRGVRFVEESGDAVLNYSGLTVFDADGRILEASFKSSDGLLELAVNESGARYPLTIDPVAQEAYLKASNAEAFDRFGESVAISGNTVVVGAPLEDSGATGVNGNITFNGMQSSGAAYVYVLTGTTWSQQASLKASNTNPGDLFGWNVAIDGDTIVVGAPDERGSGTDPQGAQGTNNFVDAGAAYVFVRNGTTWSQQAYLKASNSGPNDRFGSSVAISGDTVVLGALQESGNATGVNGDGSDNSLPFAGAAYVYVRNGVSWSQQAYLKSSSPDIGDRFGYAVDISNETIVVSARNEDSAAVGINGDATDNNAPESGAVFVFVRNGTTWSQEAYLKSSNSEAFDSFSVSVAIDEDTIVVGACDEDGASEGVGGDTSNNNASSSGAAYVFVRSGTTWSEQEYLKASNTNVDDLFGWSVAIDGQNIVVGGVLEDSSATDSSGDQLDNSSPSAGAAYSFLRVGANWFLRDYMKASNTGRDDLFGFAVAVSEGRAVVSANAENSNATGVNGDGMNDLADDAGAAYVLDLGSEFGSFCTGDGGDQMGCTNCPCNNNAAPATFGGCLNSAGTSAQLNATGDPSVSLPAGASTDLRFALSGVPANAFCILNSGDGLAPANMAHPCFASGSGSLAVAFDGLRCAIMNTRRHGGRSADANGDVGSTNAPWGGEGGPPVGIAVAGTGFSAGQTRYFQVIHRDDPLAVCLRGLNTSQALEVEFKP